VPPPAPPRPSLWSRLFGWLSKGPAEPGASPAEGDLRICRELCDRYQLPFRDLDLLALALTHRSYVHSSPNAPRESNERLEFLGDSVLGLVVTEHLYRLYPDEHEGQLTKTKSLLVSKAILSRRALAMGLGRFVLMSHSEVESGGRQRLSILADAFEAVIGAIYLDLGYDAARQFIERWLLREVGAIMSDKRHTNYKSQLQEYVQSTWRTHPIYHIRSEMGPDHSKMFMVEVLVGRRALGHGKGSNKKEAEQAAARDALEKVGGRTHERRTTPAVPRADQPSREEEEREPAPGGRRRRGRRERTVPPAPAAAPSAATPPSPPALTVHRAAPPAEELPEVEPPPPAHEEDDLEEVGRPDWPVHERRLDPYEWEESGPREAAPSSATPEPDVERDVEPGPEIAARPERLESREASERAPVGGTPEAEPPRPGSASNGGAAPMLYGRRQPRGRGPQRRP
jgi:ribonuclease-3